MEFLNLLSNLDTHIAGFIAAHGSLVYMLLFSIVFLEIGIFPLFFLPGNPLIFIAGSFCKLGSLNLWLTIITLTTAAILGNIVSYRLGKFFGHTINKHQSGWVNQDALHKTQNFYIQYGQLTLMLSPFIAVVRTFAPLLAGVSGMQFRKYLFSSTVGVTLWVVILVLAGYFFSSIAIIQKHMATIILAGLAIGLGFLGYGYIKSKVKK